MATPPITPNPFSSSAETSEARPRRFAKPVKQPADYDSKQSLRDYLQHLERFSVVNGWTEEESEEAAVFLAAALLGEAQKVLSGMTDNDCRSFPYRSVSLRNTSLMRSQTRTTV